MKNNRLKAPQTPVRSPDLLAPANVFTTRAPKDGESRFVSKGRRSMFDSDIPAKRVRVKKEVVKHEPKEYKGQEKKDGSFLMTRRVNGKFAAPLVFDASLMAKLK